MRSIGAIRQLVGQFRDARSGVAAVEFALILPIMLLLYIGMVEGSTLIAMDRKVQTVSGAVGDLVARSDGTISGGTLDDYVKIASGIMTPYSSSGLIQNVSQVKVANDGKATVDWSVRYVGSSRQSAGQRAVGSVYNLPSEIVSISKGHYVIVTEAAVSYTPLYGIVFDKAVNLYRENFFLPRFGAQIKNQ
ncbi:MAG: pilus assembly protein [Alphaproteobacteria bacterium]|jgi:Flp pilus assembly protein TadG|nr:pilus assembly protein [Alphaproteobacteria bacterium]